MSTTARQINSDIVDSALAVAEASITLSLIGCRMQAATQLQEEQLDRIGAAVAEVSRSASALAAHASESAVIAEESETEAKDGAALITAVTGDLEHAVEAATDSMQLIEGLSRRVEEVGALAASINQIASRTKLLALNAAIEAARAGEHGRGFSVVAEEVGALALATSEAAGTIAEIVTAIQRVRGSSGASSEAVRQSTERMAAGIARAEEAGEAFGRIVKDLERLSTLIADVAATSAQQARVAAELDGGARAVTGLARSTVRSSGELAQAIDEVRAAGDRVGAATVTAAGGAAAAGSAAALQSITADLAPFFALVHQQAGYFYAVYEEATARRGGTILLADLDQLNPVIHAALRRFGDSILGTGVAPARDILADQPLWVHWWFEGASGPELPRYDFDPSSPDYYNYPTHEWFHEPATRREPYIAGPYFDEGGMNAFLITLTAPVVREGRVIGVATADVRVDQIDRLCQPHLRRVGRRAALVNAAGRVVACTDPAWANPGGELEPALAEWCARAGGEPWTVGDAGQTFARSPTLPWGLLVSA